MKSRVLFVLAVILVITSLVFPLVVKTDVWGMPIDKFLESVAIVSCCLAASLVLVNRYIKRRLNGVIYLAYDLGQIEFVNSVKEALTAQHYICVPDIKSIIKGSNIKNLNLDSQFEKADMLVVLLPEGEVDLNYINFAVKAFRRMDKPIQIYCKQLPAEISSVIKPYMIFTLPDGKQSAITMIVQLVKGCMMGLESHGKNGE